MKTKIILTILFSFFYSPYVMASLQTDLQQKEQQKETIIADLKKLDNELAKTSMDLYLAKKEQTKYQQQHHETKATLKSLQQKCNVTTDAMHAQIKLMLQIKNIHPLKQLLADKEPTDISRLNASTAYIIQHEANKLRRYQNDINNYQKSIAKIKAQLESSHKQQITLEKRNQDLHAKQQQQQQSLEQLHAKIKQQRIQLQHAASIKKSPPEQNPKEYKKNLANINPVYPLACSNRPKKIISTKENRFILPTQNGTEVVSIAKGKVLFSNWLKGYGLITIIDHGQGLLSLYGHNQAIFKQTGDKVTQGEVIALAGQSGGHLNPGLYFEVRANGTSINLEHWLKNAKNL